MNPPESGITLLESLALDLRTAWHHSTDRVWEAIDSDLWRETGNAWLVLQAASPARLEQVLADPDLRARIEEARRAGERDPRTTWFGDRYAGALQTVAFFSMEFALSEALPLYSGGLGNVAGDYLKAARDLGLPMVGVGLLYQQGYFRQVIDADGVQHELYPLNEPAQLPITPVRDAAGQRVRVKVSKPGRALWLRAWCARLGSVRLYLLDSNDPANTPADRGITAQLYGGDAHTRLLQEMALGIGGWRVLRSVGLSPDVCHLNEGHAALAALERARDCMAQAGSRFDAALTATRAGNLFTTHTPVEAGFDRFDPELVEAYLGLYVREELGVRVRDLLALGRVHPDDDGEPLNMAWLAARCSGAVNAVSRRHEQVSRPIFQVLFPRWPEAEVPISHVTNGVHVPSWDSAEADELWTTACGAARWHGTPDGLGEAIAACSDEQLWSLRSRSRRRLVDFAREHLPVQRASAGLVGPLVEAADRALDADTLTIGLARRFTEYKRPGLLLHDPERLVRMLTDERRPVQIVVAGKAHPRDDAGRAAVAQWVRFARRADVRGRCVFFADYDLRLAERLVQGIDLWINTPRPPWEACGTSGMKVLVNGGLNLSVLDGWWEEAYTPDVGWAPARDARGDDEEAERFYDILEKDVIPTFYERDSAGLPRRWLSKVRASMSKLAPRFSAERAVREYTERHYVPAAASFARRAADGASHAAQLVERATQLGRRWDSIRLGDTKVTVEGGRRTVTTSVYLEDADPDSIAVELYADPTPGGSPVRIPMRRTAPLLGSRGFVYAGEIDDARPSGDYTPRVVAGIEGLAIPLELPFVRWAR